MSQVVVAYNKRAQCLAVKAMEFSITSKATIEQDREATLAEFKFFISSVQAFLTTVESQRALLENIRVNDIAKASTTTLPRKAAAERDVLYDRSASLNKVAAHATKNIMFLRRSATALEDDIKRLKTEVNDTCDEFTLKNKQLKRLETQTKNEMVKCDAELREVDQRVSTLAVNHNEAHDARVGMRFVRAGFWLGATVFPYIMVPVAILGEVGGQHLRSEDNRLRSERTMAEGTAQTLRESLLDLKSERAVCESSITEHEKQRVARVRLGLDIRRMNSYIMTQADYEKLRDAASQFSRYVANLHIEAELLMDTDAIQDIHQRTRDLTHGITATRDSALIGLLLPVKQLIGYKEERLSLSMKQLLWAMLLLLFIIAEFHVAN